MNFVFSQDDIYGVPSREISATEEKILQILQVRKFIHHNNNIVGFLETIINTKQ
jgi:hypothetical protein